MLLKLLNLSFMGSKKIVGKGQNAGYQHFLPFQQCFQEFFPQDHQKQPHNPDF